MKRIIISPGWATAGRYYRPYSRIREAEIVDFGFFGSEREIRGFAEILLESLPEEPLMVIGHSLGAAAALTAAARDRRIAKMVLFSPFAKFTAEGDCPGQDSAEVRAMEKQLKRAPTKLLADFYQAALAPEKFPIEVPPDFQTERLIEGLRWLRRFDIRDQLDQINADVLIIQGSDDQIVSLKTVSYLAERLPQVRLIVLPETGHSAIFTKANHCRNLIREFIDD